MWPAIASKTSGTSQPFGAAAGSASRYGSIGEKGSALPAVAMAIVAAHNTKSDVGPVSRGIVTITAKSTMAAPTTQPAEVRCRGVVRLGVSFTAAVIAR
jgi:hypothetical protein